MPDVSNLVKNTDYNTKMNEIEKKIADHDHHKYITTPDINNKITTENLAARLLQANSVTKTDFDNELINLNKKINSNKTKYVLVKNELKIFETFGSIYFQGKSHFEDDGT